MIRLRGHHLFCTALFQGHGYDETFTRAMTQVVEELEQGADILVADGADELCQACPHRVRSSSGQAACALGTDDVLRRDRAALEVLRLVPGQAVTSREMGRRLNAVTPSQWDQVCGGCRWQGAGLCSWETFRELCQRRFV